MITFVLTPQGKHRDGLFCNVDMRSVITLWDQSHHSQSHHFQCVSLIYMTKDVSQAEDESRRPLWLSSCYYLAVIYLKRALMSFAMQMNTWWWRNVIRHLAPAHRQCQWQWQLCFQEFSLLQSSVSLQSSLLQCWWYTLLEMIMSLPCYL